MSKMIFVNLPVADLPASMAFYAALGFENNPHFTDDTAACMVWSESIHVMLLTHDKWRSFTQRPIPPATASEVMLALSLDNREEVDGMNDTAAAQGAPPISIRSRIWGSCTTATWRTRTAMSGKRSGWTRRRSPANNQIQSARPAQVCGGVRW